MQWDGEDASARAKHRDRVLRGYVRRELGAYSPFYRQRLQEARVDPRQVRSIDDLARVRPTRWDDVSEDPGAFVAQPTQRDLVRSGDRRLVGPVLLGKLTARIDRVNREVIEPRFKPVLWNFDAGVPVGSTETDLKFVGRAGARVLTLAGLERHDVLVGLTDSGPHLAHWQIVLGARHAGVSSVHLGSRGDPEVVEAVSPQALAGTSATLLRILGGLAERGLHLPDLHAVIVTGEDPDGATRDALALSAARVGGGDTDQRPAVVAMWAPPGVRAMWAECRDGFGFHTFPDLEFLEIARAGALHPGGPGEIVWSGLDWRGTVFFRLMTGARAELVDETCAACQRRGPMVITGTRDPLDVVSVLEEREELTAFQVEFRRVDGAEELFVFVSVKRGVAFDRLLADLDSDLVATQYVVLPRRSVDAKIRSAGSRIIDAR